MEAGLFTGPLCPTVVLLGTRWLTQTSCRVSLLYSLAMLLMELTLSGQGTWDGPRAPGVLGSRLCAAVLSADAPVCVLQVE